MQPHFLPESQLIRTWSRSVFQEVRSKGLWSCLMCLSTVMSEYRIRFPMKSKAYYLLLDYAIEHVLDSDKGTTSVFGEPLETSARKPIRHVHHCEW